MSPIIATLISVLAVSLLSLVGVFLLYIRKGVLQRMILFLVSLAVGTLLGDVFFHIVPQLYSDPSYSLSASLFVLFGIFIFFCLEHFLHWHHYHDDETTHRAIHPSGYTNIVTDGLHNFVDGLIIGASFLVSIPLGITTTLAIIFHEIPQELGDFGILLNAGFSKGKAVLFNFLSATLAIAGGIVAVLIGSAFQYFSFALIGITAGGFIYLALADLVPQLHEQATSKRSVFQLGIVFLGLAIMFALTFAE